MPFVKTFVPGAKALATAVSRYDGRWHNKIEMHLTTEQFACYNALIEAAKAFLVCLNTL